jgi:hypothetical protein
MLCLSNEQKGCVLGQGFEIRVRSQSSSVGVLSMDVSIRCFCVELALTETLK